MPDPTTAKIAIDQPGEETLYVTGKVSQFSHDILANDLSRLNLMVLVDNEKGSSHGTGERDAVYRHHDSTIDHEFDVELPDLNNGSSQSA